MKKYASNTPNMPKGMRLEVPQIIVLFLDIGLFVTFDAPDFTDACSCS